MKALVFLLLAASTQLGHPAIAQETDWVKVRPLGIKAVISMPVTPRHTERRMTPDEETVIIQHQYLASINRGNTAYFFNHHEFPTRPIGTEQMRQTLDNAVTGMVNRLNGTVKKHEAIRLARNPGRELVFTYSDRKENKYIFHCRVYIRKEQMYQMNVVSALDDYSEEDAIKFFDSLQLKQTVNQPPQEKEKEKEKEDSETNGEDNHNRSNN